MTKNFVLDTNVVLHDPRAIFQFDDNNVILPIYVIEEVDQFKKDTSELGRNARQTSRYIDEYRRNGKISNGGVELPTGGRLRVVFAEESQIQSKWFVNRDSPDSKIIAVALQLQRELPDQKCVVVSKDTNLRIRADALGLKAVDYEPSAITLDELYKGSREFYVPPGFLNELFDAQALETEALVAHLNDRGDGSPIDENAEPSDASGVRLYPNQFVQLIDNTNPQHTTVARVEPCGTKLKPLGKHTSDYVWGIRARNKEQRYALSLLLDERIKLVTLVGKAGTGKTLLAIAAGMQQVVEEEMYQKLLVSRPIFPMGRDLGFLPGTMEEKLLPWMQPIFDNVELLLTISQDGKRQSSSKQLMEMGMLQIEPLTYIRGRSIPQQFMIVDEAQNLTPHEVKTIISRVGEGTKIILTGDPYQIDHPYIDASDNGLVHAVRSFQNEGIAGHITLEKGERSELAELAANLL